MADLIDRAALLEQLDDLHDHCGHCDGYGYISKDKVMQKVKTAPAVDAVEVVRCSKCELHDSCYAEDVFKTARMDLEKAFCCLGRERRTDADN